MMHPYVNETCPANNLESGPSSNSVPENYGNETWPLNNLVQPGSSSNSVPSLWTGYASQDRLLQNQQSNFMMYPGSAVPGEYYSLIENQHFNSVQLNPEVNTNCNSNFVYPGFAVASKEFYPMDKVQVNSMYPDPAVPGGVYLFANQQFSPEGALPDGLSFYDHDNWQVNSMYPGGVAVKSEMLSIHDLSFDEIFDGLTVCNNQDYGGFPHYYQNDMWPSQACGGEGASSSGSAFSCQTVCSTPESEALLSPTATNHSAGKSWKRPRERYFASPEVATNDYEMKKKKRKLRKRQCEVRISKKLPKTKDMVPPKLWLTYDTDEQMQRAKQVATYLLSGPNSTKYMNTPFDPEFEREIWELTDAVKANGVSKGIFDHVKALVDRYGKHAAT